MKNLKKKSFHKYLLCFLAGMLVVGSISVYAVSTIIDSKEVSYDNGNSKGSYDNVQLSIDELYQRYKSLSGEQDTLYTEKILNGADPVLGDGMIPITLDSKGNVKYANLYTPWYKYEEKKWANAVILVKSPSKSYKIGDTILEKDIESYFVWIPRYSYKIWDMGNYTSLQYANNLVDSETVAADGGATAFRRVAGNSRIIDVQFGASKNDNGTAVDSYHTNEAFTVLGTKGLWVGKFETGYNQMDMTGVPIDSSKWTWGAAQKDVVSSSRIVVKPNVYSWRGIKVGNIFTNAIDYEPNLKSHMMKNTEWGAVAYLSHSIYGIGTQININNYSDYKTGYSAMAHTNQSSYPGETGIEEDKTLLWNTTTGYLASTTGNITGVYDMSGGCYEYVAGYRKGQNASISGVSDSMLSTYANYFDAYEASNNDYDFAKRKLGDATGEIGPFYVYYDKDKGQRVHNGWYSDYSYFVTQADSWFLRGGLYYYGILASQFNFLKFSGAAANSSGFRLVLAVK